MHVSHFQPLREAQSGRKWDTHPRKWDISSAKRSERCESEAQPKRAAASS